MMEQLELLNTNKFKNSLVALFHPLHKDPSLDEASKIWSFATFLFFC